MSDEQGPFLHCIILDARRQRLLLVDVEGGCELPTLAGFQPGWFATEVHVVGRRIREEFGLDATVLRDLGRDGHRRWCEVEVHGGRPSCGRWAPIGCPPGLAEAHRRVVETWLAESDELVPPQRPAWERPGWYRQAEKWIHRQLRDLGLQSSGPVRQHKAAWSWSCLLVVPTTTGRLFFKASYDKPPGEVALILALQPRWAQCLPRLLAADERGWMLMEDFDGEPIEEMPGERWGAAAARLAQLQIDCAGEAKQWLDLGCPDRRTARLPSLLAQVLDDTEVLFSDPKPLTRTDVTRLRMLLPTIARLCERLAAGPIPDTLHNQDFRSGNLIAIGFDFLFYDWGDTVLSHPFFSVQRMLDYVPCPGSAPRWHWRMAHRGDQLRRTIRDAYLAAWTGTASRRCLREAFVLSRQLNVAYQVIRWYQEIRHVEVESQWGRVMPSATKNELRRLLEMGTALKAESRQ